VARGFGRVDARGRPVIAAVLPNIEAINGPRVAGLRIGVGQYAAEIVSLLEKHDMALLRQSVPTGRDCPDAIRRDVDPLTGWYGRKWVVYLPWSDRLAEKDVQTHTLIRKDAWRRMKAQGDFWIAGLEEHYQPVMLSLDLREGSPHYFFMGSTTSGKSTALQNAVAQLALCRSNRFVFIDAAKKADGLGIIPALKGAIAPPACSLDEARAALVWLRDEIEARYNGASRDTRIIVVIDELPALSDDPLCVKIVDALASAGAQCRMHLLLAAQHAVERALGPFAGILKANCSGRVVFHTSNLAGSVEGLYDKRALYLRPPGDCYALNANLPPVRLQASYFPEVVLRERWEFGPPEMSTWPEVSSLDLPAGGNGAGAFSDGQIAEAVRIRLEGRLRKKSRGYGRTVIEARLGVNQNQSVRLCRIADTILDSVWKVRV